MFCWHTPNRIKIINFWPIFPLSFLSSSWKIVTFGTLVLGWASSTLDTSAEFSLCSEQVSGKFLLTSNPSDWLFCLCRYIMPGAPTFYWSELPWGIGMWPKYSVLAQSPRLWKEFVKNMVSTGRYGSLVIARPSWGSVVVPTVFPASKSDMAGTVSTVSQPDNQTPVSQVGLIEKFATLSWPAFDSSVSNLLYMLIRHIQSWVCQVSGRRKKELLEKLFLKLLLEVKQTE